MKTKAMVIAAVWCAAAWTVDVSKAEACGTFIPIDGETATLDAQRVIMSYDPDTNTTRVIAQIGFQGDLTAFSWIIPLPSEPSNVQALGEESAQLFAELDDYGSPRFGISTCGLNGGDGGSAVDGPGVTVLAGGVTGAFEYVVLTGTGGSAVTDWLVGEGYSVPDGMADVAHTYIREGHVFMAMKVNPSDHGVTALDPAIRFDYEGWPGYPLRINQPTTTDEVEIILNIIAPQDIRFATPLDRSLSDSSIEWDGRDPRYLDALRQTDGWVVEHRGSIGEWFGGDWGGIEIRASENAWALLESELGLTVEDAPTLTRLHGIFRRGALSEDVAITAGEHSDISKVHQLFQSCDDDWADLDGELDSDGDGVPDSQDAAPQDASNDRVINDGLGGCSTTGSTPGSELALLLGLGWLARRRRD